MTVAQRISSKGFDARRFEVRLLKDSEADIASYRALRDKIRHSEGARNFADSYTREDELNDAAWREWCTPKRDHCIVGTFDKQNENKLVSIMMITAQGPKDSLIAEWEATWVEPEYRGSGIAKQAYAEVHRISRELGYHHAVVFIRDDNHHSRVIRQAQGFSYLRTKKDEHWADGSVADTNLFILDLSSDCLNERGNRAFAIARLEKTLESLKSQAPFIQEAIKDRIADLHDEQSLWQPQKPQTSLAYG